MKKELQDYFRVYSENCGLTVQEHERIFETVLKKTRRDEISPLLRRLESPYVKGVLAFALCLVLFAPAAWLFVDSRRDSGASDVIQSYSARGGVAEPLVVVGCAGVEESGLCHRDDIMVFRVRPTPDKTYFSAFSRHIKSNAVVWYYPTSDKDRSLSIADLDRGGVISEGILIGEEHALGEHEVISIFSDRALSLSDIRKLFDENGEMTRRDYAVVKSTLRIEE